MEKTSKMRPLHHLLASFDDLNLERTLSSSEYSETRFPFIRLRTLEPKYDLVQRFRNAYRATSYNTTSNFESSVATYIDPERKPLKVIRKKRIEPQPQTEMIIEPTPPKPFPRSNYLSPDNLTLWDRLNPRRNGVQTTSPELVLQQQPNQNGDPESMVHHVRTRSPVSDDADIFGFKKRVDFLYTLAKFTGQKEDKESSLKQLARTIYCTKYQIFHTGSNGTIVFSLGQGEARMEFFRYLFQGDLEPELCEFELKDLLMFHDKHFFSESYEINMINLKYIPNVNKNKFKLLPEQAKLIEIIIYGAFKEIGNEDLQSFGKRIVKDFPALITLVLTQIPLNSLRFNELEQILLQRFHQNISAFAGHTIMIRNDAMEEEKDSNSADEGIYKDSDESDAEQ